MLMRVFYPDYGKPPVKELVSDTPKAPGAPASLSSAPSVSGTAPVPLSADEMKTVSTDFGPYLLTFSEKHGSIIDVGFKDFIDFTKDRPLEFLHTRQGNFGIGALDIVLNGKAQDLAFTGAQIRQNEVVARGGGRGFTVEKVFDFSSKKYGNTLEIAYTNTSTEPQNLEYRISSGTGLVVKNAIDVQYFETNWLHSGRVEHLRNGFIHKPVPKDKVNISKELCKAVSVKDRHFSSVLMPEGTQGFHGAATLAGGAHGYSAALVRPVFTVQPGERVVQRFLLYIGPNDMKDLTAYNLQEIVHFGKLDGICKLLIGLMQLVYGLVRNYGIAIILLTIGLNLMLFPFTRASFLSMKRMQLVQPQMNKIREKYANDATKMHKEMTELYKKYKVNPLGSCLPMLLQMPIFISLYVALSKSTELLNAKFLWIEDLACPDRVHLPFTLPMIGKMIHVLPLIMVVGMFAQQKIAQANMVNVDPKVAEQQRMMMYIMPVFFGFLFYPTPSGLVLYWLTNTVMTMIIQLSLRKAVVELPAVHKL